MSYQVLARKWRPRSFPEMVGQTHVLRALIHALDSGRLHHAYLFTGTRGVGKTTVARIFAKSLNCEQGVSSRPCGVCGACTEINEGRFVDLIEVDAASRTKVEDTRELLENVQYAPTRGRYKVYLIDEVHMLSAHSFNALLKTLEEPPPHVKFLLATTDPQRLPVTILSRCLQFSLKRLPPEQIAEHLGNVLKAEAVNFEPAALRELARGADGSMRDALSLLDQAIAHGGGAVTATEVRGMLGSLDRDQVWGLLEALVERDGAELLRRVAALAEFAPDYESVLAELISLLYRIAVGQQVPDALDDDERERVLALAQRLSPEDVQLYYQIGLIGRRDLPLAPEPRGGFEMIMLRMLAFRPDDPGAAVRQEAPPAPAPRRPADAPPAPPAAPRAEAPAAPAPAVQRTTAQGRPFDGDWASLIAQLRLDGMVRQLAVNCALKAREGDIFHLTLAPAHRSLHSKKLEERLQFALSQYLGSPARLTFSTEEAAAATPAVIEAQQREQRQRAAEQAIEHDANVQALQQTFNARILPDSVRPAAEGEQDSLNHTRAGV